jgi:hypothetical protein
MTSGGSVQCGSAPLIIDVNAISWSAMMTQDGFVKAHERGSFQAANSSPQDCSGVGHGSSLRASESRTGLLNPEPRLKLLSDLSDVA